MKLFKQCLWAITLMLPLALQAQKEIVIKPEKLTMEVGRKAQTRSYGNGRW